LGDSFHSLSKRKNNAGALEGKGETESEILEKVRVASRMANLDSTGPFAPPMT